MKRKENYRLLRDAGFNSYDATRYKDMSDDNIADLIKKYKLNIGDKVHLLNINRKVGIISDLIYNGLIIKIIYVAVTLEGTSYVLPFTRSEIEKVT